MKKYWMLLCICIVGSDLTSSPTYTWIPPSSCSPTPSLISAANWTPGGFPGPANASLLFPSAGGHCLSILNDYVTPPLPVGPWVVQDSYVFTGEALQVSGNQSLAFTGQNSVINVGGVTLSSGALWQVTGGGPITTNTVQASLTGTGTLQIASGPLILSGSNAATVPIIIGTTGGAAGTLGLGSSLALAGSSLQFASNGSVLNLFASGVVPPGVPTSYNATVTALTGAGLSASIMNLGSGTLTLQLTSGTTTYAGTLTSTNGGLTLNGAGTLILSGNNGGFSSAAAPATVTVKGGGTLQATSSNALGVNPILTIGDASTLSTLDLTGIPTTSYTVQQLFLYPHGQLNLGAKNLTIAQGGSIALTTDSQINGSGSVTLGAGNFTWLGTPVFTGEVVVDSGATFYLARIGTISKLTFGGGGTFIPVVNPMTIPGTTTVRITPAGIATFNTSSTSLVLNTSLSGDAGSTLLQVGGNSLTLGAAVAINNANINVQNELDTTAVNVLGPTAIGNSSNLDLTSNTSILKLNNYNQTIANLAGMPGSTVNLGSATLTVNAGSSAAAYYGTIIGTGGLTLSGGTTSLVNGIGYSGATKIANGSLLQTLNLSSTTSLAFGDATLGAGGSLQLGSEQTFSYPITILGQAAIGLNGFNLDLTGSSISGVGGTLVQTGLGNLKLPLTVTLGTIQVNNGTLQLPSSAAGLNIGIIETGPNACGTVQATSDLTFPGTVNLYQPGYLDSNGHTLNLSGVIQGATSVSQLHKIGAGTVILSNPANLYSGSTILEQGTLQITTAFSSNSTALAFYGTAADTSRTFQVGSGAFSSLPSSVGVFFVNQGSINTNGFPLTIAGIIQGVTTTDPLNSFTKIGAGTLTLTGANTYTMPTLVSVGTLQAGVATVGTTSGAFGVGSAVNVYSGATLALNGYNNTIGSLQGASSSHVTLGVATLSIANGMNKNFGGVISGTGGLALNAGTLTLSGSNTYGTYPGSATTIASGAILQAGAANAFSPNSVVNVTGTLNLNGFDNSVGGLQGVGAVSLGARTLTIQNGQGLVFAGAISGTGGGVTLSGGTQILTGTANTYSGATTIAPGATLQAGAINAFSSASIITANGTLDLHNYNNVIKGLLGGGAVTLGSGTLTIQDGIFSGTITGAGGLTLSTNASLTLTGNSNIYSGGTSIANGAHLIAGAVNTFSSNSDVVIDAGGTLDSATYNNSVKSITNNGIVTTQALLTATNGYTQNSTGALTLTEPGSSAGKIVTSSALSLAGALTVNNTGAAPAGGTTWTLLQSTGAGKKLSGTFASGSTTLPANSSLHYDTSSNTVSLIFSDPVTTCNGIWGNSSSSYWDLSTNWTTSCVPGIGGSSAPDTATFPSLSASAVTVALNNSSGVGQAVALYKLSITADTTAYTFQRAPDGGGAITMIANGSNNPAIYVTGPATTSNVSYVPIFLNADTTCFISDATLELRAGINGTYSFSICEGTGGTGLVENYASTQLYDFFLKGSGLANYSEIYANNLTIGGVANISQTALLSNSSAGYLSGNTITIGADGATMVTNQGNIAAGGDLSIVTSGSGTTILTNTGRMRAIAGNLIINGTGTQGSITNQGTMMSAGRNVVFQNGTVVNSFGGQIFSGSGYACLITGATVSNDSLSTLGSSAANFSFTGGSLENGGTILADTYTQGSSVNLQLDLFTATSFGHIAANNASLAGGLIVVAQPGFTPVINGTMNLITIQNNNLNTQFNPNVLFQNFPSYVDPTIQYYPNLVQIFFGPGKVPPVPPSPSALTAGVYQQVAAPVIQHNMKVLRKCVQLRERFNLTFGSEAVGQDTSVAPEELYAANDAIEERSSSVVTQSSVQQRRQEQLHGTLARPNSTKPWNFYTAPIASFGSLDRRGEQHGMGYHSVGALAGFDYAFSELLEDRRFDAGMGFVINYQKLGGTLDQHQGSSSADKIHGTLYGTVVPRSIPELAYEGLIGYNYVWNELKRTTGLNQTATATASPSTQLFCALLGLEYKITHCAWGRLPEHFSITPVIDVQYLFAHQQSYTEQGAGIYNLHVSKQTPEALSTLLDLRLIYDIIRPCCTISVEIDGGWQREYLPVNEHLSYLLLAAPNEPLSAVVLGSDRNTWFMGLDILTTIGSHFQIEVSSDVRLSKSFYDASFYLGFGGVF